MRNFYSLIFVLLIGFSGNSQIINIPDEYFKMILTVQSTVYGYAKDINGQSMIVDANNDGEIEVSEAEAVYSLYASHSASDLTGIEYFINLRRLRCDTGYLSTLNLTTLTHLQVLECQNNNLTSLNITGLSELTTLYGYANELTNLDLTGCTSLTLLWLFDNHLNSINVSALSNLNDFRCYQNNLSSLNVSNLSHLTHLECYNNNLANLDMSGTTNLQELSCSHNQLSSLNLSGLSNLTKLVFGFNPISTIDVSDSPLINWIDISGTNFTTMDFSQIPLLGELICTNCPLTSIDVSNNPNVGEIVCENSPILESVFMKNGRINGLYALNSPMLRYVCVDQVDLDYMGDLAGTYLEAINFNTYCSFTPGGAFYTIQGNSRYDENNNGCDASDNEFPNLKCNITDGNIQGTAIADETGSYVIPVQAGTHTITPILENPAYFTVSPASVSVTFPGQASPVIQDFCISANGVHNDLEITLTPITAARPGFDATYKLVYKNKGTAAQSGSISLVFDDAVLDFVSATTIPASQTTGNVSWNFTDLHPFETVEITLAFNLNSPMESPALNGGDVLNYTASISGLTDETPLNNSASLHQQVINSLDPNKKICLEGTAITPEKVGDYVHYVIYFENSGTANAENIVVKDVLDAAKFDIASLIPTDGSHSFKTRISDNKVEFIFENINLPFDDAHNDGYVAFKVKTLPNLALNSSFSNSADIYFDYNFPITTDAAVTTITTLSNPDFEFADYISLYPNPVKDILNIKVKNSIQISSVKIYNTLGQLVMIAENPNESIDVAALSAGTYFIMVNSDKGTAGSKFIRK